MRIHQPKILHDNEEGNDEQHNREHVDSQELHQHHLSATEPEPGETVTEDEMVKLVRICHIAENADDASARLYNRLKHERDDILLDAGIGSKNDKCLAEIYKYLKANFSMED